MRCSGLLRPLTMHSGWFSHCIQLSEGKSESFLLWDIENFVCNSTNFKIFICFKEHFCSLCTDSDLLFASRNREFPGRVGASLLQVLWAWMCQGRGAETRGGLGSR